MYLIISVSENFTDLVLLPIVSVDSRSQCLASFFDGITHLPWDTYLSKFNEAWRWLQKESASDSVWLGELPFGKYF